MKKTGLDEPELVGHWLQRIGKDGGGGELKPAKLRNPEPEWAAFFGNGEWCGDPGILRVHAERGGLA